MSRRVMPKRCARFSAVCPISRPQIGSVRPFISAMTGAKYAGRNFASSAARWPVDFAAYHFDSQCTIASEKSSGARDSASTPPASTRFERPARMLLTAESIDCMPDAQLRITVQPGTLRPQPIRSAATRPMLTSSADGAAQPRITSSSSRRLERLPQQQRAAGVRREVGRGKRVPACCAP